MSLSRLPSLLRANTVSNLFQQKHTLLSLPSRRMSTSIAFDVDTVKSIEKLSFPFPTLDPFLFCVYHKDMYPPGNGKMEAPRVGNGQDFDPDQPYRMYHGKKVPGFPQHPHRGFETITATLDGSGYIDHCDSLGNAGRYGEGDLQWMTAGKGVVHSEMFPLLKVDAPNPLRFFQIWLNLPAKKKMVDPAFVMHWSSPPSLFISVAREQIPRFQTSDGLINGVCFAGEIEGKKGLPSTPNSWAADPKNEVAVWFMNLKPGAEIILPTATDATVNRRIYVIEGNAVEVGGETVRKGYFATLRANGKTQLKNLTDAAADVLILQGRPIGEPVAQHGPFVMNNRQEIMQAFMDYQTTRFGGWPWENDDQHFPMTKGRFALQNGKEEFPPSSQ